MYKNQTGLVSWPSFDQSLMRWKFLGSPSVKRSKTLPFQISRQFYCARFLPLCKWGHADCVAQGRCSYLSLSLCVKLLYFRESALLHSRRKHLLTSNPLCQQSKDPCPRSTYYGGRDAAATDERVSNLYAPAAMISTMGSSTVGGHLGTAQMSRLHAYQPAALSAVVNLNTLNQQVPPSLTRNDRRALASLGMGPVPPGGSARHKNSTRKVGPPHPRLENDMRMGLGVEDSRGVLSSNNVDARLLDTINPGLALRRRTLSASGLRTLQDCYPQGNSARLNSRFAGSTADLQSSEGNSPYGPGQQYMCSVYALPTALKVAPQQNNGAMNLSVISGPAPVTYRPDPSTLSSRHDSAAEQQPHRLSTTAPAQLLRCVSRTRARVCVITCWLVLEHTCSGTDVDTILVCSFRFCPK